MIVFAKSNSGSIYAIHSQNPISSEDKEKLNWLLDGKVLDNNTLEGFLKVRVKKC